MNIEIIAIGKCREGVYLSLLDKYTRRMQWKVSILEIDAGRKATALQQENLLLSKLNSKSNIIVVLDEIGTSISSEDFAIKFRNWQNTGSDNISFLIGGADGLSDNIRKKANFLLSFGKQTWPHMLVRVMLLEQIYRAQQILAGHPYHRS